MRREKGSKKERERNKEELNAAMKREKASNDEKGRK
jgi:hypothetical protein